MSEIADNAEVAIKALAEHAEKLRAESAGIEAFRVYVSDLANLAKAAQAAAGKWAKPLSRKARGELSGHWSTPRSVVDEALAVAQAAELGSRIGVDFAADPGSTLAEDWFGPFHMDRRRRDALAADVSWGDALAKLAPGALGWLNPPYSHVRAFASKAALEFPARPSGRSLLFLVFARMDTIWFHRYVLPKASSIWVRMGRIAFVDSVTGSAGQVAPAPSMLVTFGEILHRDTPPVVGPWALVYRRSAAYGRSNVG